MTRRPAGAGWSWIHDSGLTIRGEEEYVQVLHDLARELPRADEIPPGRMVGARRGRPMNEGDMMRFAKVDAAVLQIADEAAASRETKARQHFEALRRPMHSRLLHAARADLVEDCATLALLARALFPGSTAAAADDFYGTQNHYADLYKHRLINELLDLDIWLRARAEAALRRLQVAASLSARDCFGVPLFEPDRPVTWYRIAEPVKLALVVYFLLSADDPREIRWLR